MSVSAIAGTTSSAGSAGKSLQTLGTDDFLRLLITELSNQDPFEPMKNQDLLNQISAIRSLESNQQLNSTLANLALQGNLSSAGSLIGKMVTGLTFDRQLTEGLVTGVRVSEGKVMLELDSGHMINVTDIRQVRSGEATAADAG